VLGFRRLLWTLHSRAKGSSQWVNTAEGFGLERVREVAGHIGRMEAAIEQSDAQALREAAEAMLARWKQGP